MGNPTVLTICVNYQNDAETVRFVRGLLAQEGASNQKAIIVDNSASGPAEGPLQAIADGDQRVWLIVPASNLGYYGGAAFALRHYLSQSPLPEWVMVSNTDLEFLQPDFLRNLCAFHAEASYAVVAPAILSSLSREDQNPCMRVRPSPLRMHLYKWLFRVPTLLKLYEAASSAGPKARQILKTSKPRPGEGREPMEIYAAHGSCILFHRSYFAAGGTLDHGAFLFGEEIFVAETARQLGLRIGYDPRLRLIHNGSASTRLFKPCLLMKAEAAAYSADRYFTAKRPFFRNEKCRQ